MASIDNNTINASMLQNAMRNITKTVQRTTKHRINMLFEHILLEIRHLPSKKLDQGSKFIECIPLL